MGDFTTGGKPLGALKAAAFIPACAASEVARSKEAR